jgi:hypothetical protein
MTTNKPLERLRHHVSGAIARGEAKAIVAVPAVPHLAKKGLIARLAIQCVCPDTGETGDFLFSGESHRNKQSRVTPIYHHLGALFDAVKPDWEIISNKAPMSFIKR